MDSNSELNSINGSNDETTSVIRDDALPSSSDLESDNSQTGLTGMNVNNDVPEKCENNMNVDNPNYDKPGDDDGSVVNVDNVPSPGMKGDNENHNTNSKSDTQHEQW